MNKIAKTLSVAAVCFAQIGCASLPVDNGRLNASIGSSTQKHFSILVPQAKDQYELTYLKGKIVTESPQCTYASFGPAAFDMAIYRVEVCKKSRNISLAKNIDIIAEGNVDIISHAYGRTLHLLSSKTKVIDNRTAYYRAYTQSMPEHLSGLNMVGAEENIYVMYYFEKGGYVVMLSGQFSSASGRKTYTLKHDAGLIKSGNIPVMYELIRSLRIEG